MKTRKIGKTGLYPLEETIVDLNEHHIAPIDPGYVRLICATDDENLKSRKERNVLVISAKEKHRDTLGQQNRELMNAQKKRKNIHNVERKLPSHKFTSPADVLKYLKIRTKLEPQLLTFYRRRFWGNRKWLSKQKQQQWKMSVVNKLKEKFDPKSKEKRNANTVQGSKAEVSASAGNTNNAPPAKQQKVETKGNSPTEKTKKLVLAWGTGTDSSWKLPIKGHVRGPQQGLRKFVAKFLPVLEIQERDTTKCCGFCGLEMKKVSANGKLQQGVRRCINTTVAHPASVADWPHTFISRDYSAAVNIGKRARGCFHPQYLPKSKTTQQQ